MSLWPKVREELNTIVNRHFETPEYRQLFAVKLTPARQAIWDVHYPHYIKSRRDCWGAAAVKAPLDVKRAIWEHEKDELIYDARMGSAHLTDQQMAEAADVTRESSYPEVGKNVYQRITELASEGFQPSVGRRTSASSGVNIARNARISRRYVRTSTAATRDSDVKTKRYPPVSACRTNQPARCIA